MGALTPTVSSSSDTVTGPESTTTSSTNTSGHSTSSLPFRRSGTISLSRRLSIPFLRRRQSGSKTGSAKSDSDLAPVIVSPYNRRLFKSYSLNECEAVIDHWVFCDESMDSLPVIPSELIHLISLFYQCRVSLDNFRFDQQHYQSSILTRLSNDSEFLHVCESASFSMIYGTLTVDMFDSDFRPPPPPTPLPPSSSSSAISSSASSSSSTSNRNKYQPSSMESDYSSSISGSPTAMSTTSDLSTMKLPSEALRKHRKRRLRKEYRYVCWELTFHEFHTQRTYNYFGLLPCTESGVPLCFSGRGDTGEFNTQHRIESPDASGSLGSGDMLHAWAITYGAATVMVCSNLKESDVSMVSDQHGNSTLAVSKGLCSAASRFYHPPWKPGDRLTVEVDRLDRIMTVYRNDERLGVAYRNIPPRVCFVVNPFGTIQLSMVCYAK